MRLIIHLGILLHAARAMEEFVIEEITTSVDDILRQEREENLKGIEENLENLKEIMMLTKDYISYQGESLNQIEEKVLKAKNVVEEVVIDLQPKKEFITETSDSFKDTSLSFEPVTQENPTKQESKTGNILIPLAWGSGTGGVAFGVTKGAFILGTVTGFPASIIPIAIGGVVGLSVFIGKKIYIYRLNKKRNYSGLSH